MDPSPFSSVLRTNYAPNEAEVQEIRDLCVLPSEELLTLEAQIEQLQARRDMLKAQIDAHMALLSPARRLSSEILQNIFTLCLPENRNPCMHKSEAPLLLVSMCQRWRMIAIDTPRLWSRLHISIPVVTFGASRRIEQRIYHKCLNMMKTWLIRSGSQLPLSISLVYHKPSHAIFPQYDERGAFGDALLGYAKRWGDIRIDMPPSFLGSFARLPRGESLPLLTSFSFGDQLIPNSGSISSRNPRDRFWGLGSLIDDQGGLHFLQHASLKCLRLNTEFHAPSVSFNGTNLRNLTFYVDATNRLDDAGDNTIRGILTRCPRLESLEIKIPQHPRNTSTWDPDDIHVTHPSLKSFRTLSMREACTFSLWSQMRLPNLQELSFSFNDADDQWIESEAISTFCEPLGILLCESSPTLSLRTLTVFFDRASCVRQLLLFLPKCVHLVSLVISMHPSLGSGKWVDEVFVNSTLEDLFSKLQISHPMSNATLVPNLTSLVVRGSLPESFTNSTQLRECLRSRLDPSLDGVARLETFTIGYEQTTTAVDIKEGFVDLKEFEKLGLKLTIEAPDRASNGVIYSPFHGLLDIPANS